MDKDMKNTEYKWKNNTKINMFKFIYTYLLYIPTIAIDNEYGCLC